MYYNYNQFYKKIAAFSVSKSQEQYKGTLGENTILSIISADLIYQEGDSVGSYGPRLIQQFLFRSLNITNVVLLF